MSLNWNLESGNQIKPDQFAMVPVKGFSGGLKKIDNLFVPSFITNISCVKLLEVKPGDTFIIGYPKSGLKNIRNWCIYLDFL